MRSVAGWRPSAHLSLWAMFGSHRDLSAPLWRPTPTEQRYLGEISDERPGSSWGSPHLTHSSGSRAALCGLLGPIGRSIWTESKSARWPSQDSTVCHLPARSWYRPLHSVMHGQCWACPVPSSVWAQAEAALRLEGERLAVAGSCTGPLLRCPSLRVCVDRWLAAIESTLSSEIRVLIKGVR